eukprot:668398-Pyramimonas_sp.AAC.1
MRAGMPLFQAHKRNSIMVLNSPFAVSTRVLSLGFKYAKPHGSAAARTGLEHSPPSRAGLLRAALQVLLGGPPNTAATQPPFIKPSQHAIAL